MNRATLAFLLLSVFVGVCVEGFVTFRHTQQRSSSLQAKTESTLDQINGKRIIASLLAGALVLGGTATSSLAKVGEGKTRRAQHRFELAINHHSLYPFDTR